MLGAIPPSRLMVLDSLVCSCCRSFLSHLWSVAEQNHIVSATKDNGGRTARQYMLELEKSDEYQGIVKLLQLGSRLFILL